jgi:hypothetical protein
MVFCTGFVSFLILEKEVGDLGDDKSEAAPFEEGAGATLTTGRRRGKIVNDACTEERIMRETHDLDSMMLFPTVFVKFKMSQSGISF